MDHGAKPRYPTSLRVRVRKRDPSFSKCALKSKPNPRTGRARLQSGQKERRKAATALPEAGAKSEAPSEAEGNRILPFALRRTRPTDALLAASNRHRSREVIKWIPGIASF